MTKTIENHPYLIIFTIVFIMLGVTIDAVPVSIMEARNFISAREMLTDNNWLLTTMNGEPRYQKPPLPTWITACFGALFGANTILTLRWPALIMVVIVGSTIYKFSKLLGLQKNQALLNGCIVITSFYVLGITIEGAWDIYTHGFMLLAIYNIFYMLNKKELSLKHSVYFVLCFAASFLSKGPVSLYVLFLSFAISYGISFGYPIKSQKANYVKYILLLVLGITMGASWFIYVRIFDAETFTKIATKETANWSSYNVRPFYYYWSFFVQSGLWTIPAFISLLYPYMIKRVKHIKAYKFAFWWTIIAVILLSIIPEKKSRYLMPVLIPLAVTIGCYLQYAILHFKNLKLKERFALYFNFGLIASIAIILGCSIVFTSPYFNTFPLVRYLIFSVISIAIGLAILHNLNIKRIATVIYLCIAFMVSIGAFALPLTQYLKTNSYKPLKQLQNSKLPLYMLDGVSPEAIFNYGKKIPKLQHTLPQQTQFNVTCKTCNFSNYTDKYNIEFLDTFNLNTAKRNTKAHNVRLQNKVYTFTKR